MRSPAELSSAFRESGLKVTPQRQLLFRLLHDNATHPTADALYASASQQMPGISLRTVYQTLTDLTSMGELQSFDFGNGATRFDPNVGSHHHVVCRSCHEVADVYVDAAADLDVAGLEGFTIDRSDIVFHGVCARCSATPHATTPQPTSQTNSPTTGDMP
ncbi:MAG: fur 2 [Ilumatobacteraceae bacterium]|nr:fur 2 [Ilumatobacteraceae bacterium]MCU1387489.1 fur 2 [Ilumatobacteraceae bacterium]